MSKLKSKQILKYLGLPVTTAVFNANGLSMNITSVLTTCLTTAGTGGTSVTLQPTAVETTTGVVTSKRVTLIQSPSGFLPLSNNNRVVYGKITHSSGVYTLTFYYLDATGTETAYNFTTSTPVTMVFTYRFEFHQAPVDLLVNQGFQKNTKKVITITNQSSIVIPYESDLFGLVPVIQFWDTDLGNKLTAIQAVVDSLVTPTEITITFGALVNGLLVIM